jgi:hypothetical protein
MSDSSAPRKAELILQSLGANTEFRETVVGDLAEEFALRAGWDGPAAARRWYYRECLRVAPYLLRDWWRELHRNDVGHLANMLGIASVCMLALQPLLMLIVRGIAFALGTPRATIVSMWESPIGSVVLPVTLLLFALGEGALGGYVAARLGRRAPLPTMLSLGVVWATLIIVSNLLAGQSSSASPIPVWFRIANATTMMTGIIAGGVFRTWRVNVHETPSPVFRGVETR